MVFDSLKKNNIKEASELLKNMVSGIIHLSDLKVPKVPEDLYVFNVISGRYKNLFVFIVVSQTKKFV